MTAPSAKSSGLRLAACNTWLQKSALMATASHCMASGRRIGEAVKAVDQADSGGARHSVRAVAGSRGFGGQGTARPTIITQRRNHIGEKIRRHAHVGVTDQNQIVLCEFFKLNELGDLGVRAGQPITNNELRVVFGFSAMSSRTILQTGSLCVGDAEEDLRPAGVILIEPASEGFGGGCVAAFERFEQGDGGANLVEG